MLITHTVHVLIIIIGIDCVPYVLASQCKKIEKHYKISVSSRHVLQFFYTQNDNILNLNFD